MQWRRRLPPRHESRIIKFRPRILGGVPALHLMLGYYLSREDALRRRSEGREAEPTFRELGEVFVAGPLSGTMPDSLRKEFAALLSLALQWGMPLADFAANVQRDQQGRPLTVFGEIVDELMKEQPGGAP